MVISYRDLIEQAHVPFACHQDRTKHNGDIVRFYSDMMSTLLLKPKQRNQRQIRRDESCLHCSVKKYLDAFDWIGYFLILSEWQKPKKLQ
jgi:hypothetical protein